MSASGPQVAYLTDVEGMWHKVESFALDNPLVRLEGGRLVVAAGALFVFGGDAMDRGDSGRRVLAALLEARRRQPEQVVLLAGNRDINKLRLWRELQGHPLPRVPEALRAGPRGPLLRWILENTMGARHAFEHRRVELAREGRASDDEAVAASCLEDVAPGGPMRAFLQECRVAFRLGATLFVHGGVTDESLFRTPAGKRSASVDEWVEDLNAWYRVQLARGEEEWGELIAYQAPRPGTKKNRSSVVYGRSADPLNNPLLPPREVVAALERDGVRRIVCGHTPNGDTPSLLCAGGFELVVGDTSHSRVRSAPRLLVSEEQVAVRGETELDGGERAAVEFERARGDPGPVGWYAAQTGELVKGRLRDGRWLLFKYLEGFRVAQRAVADGELARLQLVAPPYEASAPSTPAP